MAILRSEKGAALVTALMLTMLALVISMALLYTVTTGTKVSASQRRYRTALAAAQGGVELFTQEIIPRLLQAAPQDTLQKEFALIDLQLPQFSCLRTKIDYPTAEWATSCSYEQATSDPVQSPDATFRLKSESLQGQGYKVYTKIVDSVPGNSDRSDIVDLDLGSSVSGRDVLIHPRHVPGIYSLSVQGMREGTDTGEKARLSVLYSY